MLWELEQDSLKAVSLNLNSRRALISRFDRSWTALSPTEQRLFAGLSLLGGAFPRAVAVDLAFVVMDNSEKNIVINLADDLALLAQKYVASLVTYALVEPLPEQRLRLHSLLREYSASRLKEFPVSMRETLERVIQTFWRRYGQEHPNYEGMSGMEAESVWLANEALDHELTSSQATRPMLTLSSHAGEVLKLALHIKASGERHRARARILESLSNGEIFDTTATQYLAKIDQDEPDYNSAIKRYQEALRLYPRCTNIIYEVLQNLQIKAANRSDQERMLRFVRIKQERDAEHICKLLNALMRIGRSSDADIVLNDNSVSGIHIALIPLSGGDYGIRDEGSTNGTRVNGQAVNSYRNLSSSVGRYYRYWENCPNL